MKTDNSAPQQSTTGYLHFRSFVRSVDDMLPLHSILIRLETKVEALGGFYPESFHVYCQLIDAVEDVQGSEQLGFQRRHILP